MPRNNYIPTSIIDIKGILFGAKTHNELNDLESASKKVFSEITGNCEYTGSQMHELAQDIRAELGANAINPNDYRTDADGAYGSELEFKRTLARYPLRFLG